MVLLTMEAYEKIKYLCIMLINKINSSYKFILKCAAHQQRKQIEEIRSVKQ